MKKRDKIEKVKWETLYDLGDTVMIDGDKSIKAVILGVWIVGTRENIKYSVGWMNDGQSYQCDLHEWRLTPWAE